MGPDAVAKPQPPAITALSADQTGRLLRLATYASVSTAALLILAKLVAWLMTPPDTAKVRRFHEWLKTMATKR